MTAKKSENIRALRSRSITRGEGISSPTATSTPARSPGKARPSARPSNKSPVRNLRTRSPARSKSGASPPGQRKSKSPARTPPRQSKPTSSVVKSAPAGRSVTPTRQSTRQAERSHLTARISPVSAGRPTSHLGREDLPPTPTEQDFRTDEKLQKIVDKYLTEAPKDKKLSPVKRTGDDRASNAVQVVKKWLSVVYRLVVILFTCVVVLVFLFTPLVASLACGLKSCSFTTLPSLPLKLSSYFDLEAVGAVTGWLVGAAILSALPLSRLTTLTNVSGLNHSYRNNGLAGLVIVGGLLSAAYAYKLPVFTFLSSKFLPLVTTLYIYTLLLSGTVYVKARWAKRQALTPFSQSGGFLTRFLVGCETNPKLFGLVDVKSMLIIHMSLLTWLVLDTAVVMEAFQRGRLDVAMVLVAICQAIYLFDFIMFERGLSTTMLMTADGVGLSLISQCLLFKPIVHSTILRYLLAAQPALQWSHPAIAGIAITFLAGYIIYRSSSYQKDSYRKMPHHPGFSGYELIPSPAGRSLLCGGSWWKLCRHPNHLGVVIMSVAIAIPSGFANPLTYMYPLVIILGLLLRERRMEKLCESRHGNAWTRYTQAVRSRLVPYIY